MHYAFIAAPVSACYQSMRNVILSAIRKPLHCRLFFVSSLLFLGAVLTAAPSDQQSIKARTKRAYMEGDIMLGVLMPMHKQSDKKNDYRQACGVIWEGYGIHRLEQFFRTVDEINARNDILPGIKLGYDVRDSCWTIPVALEQSIDFIRNKIGTLDKQMAGGGVGTIEASQSGQVVSSLSRGTDCSPQQRGKTIAALIGPGSSTISGPIQNVLQLFEIPEIDFGATAVELSDKNKHRYFSRVVPSDKQQARVLVDIILRHNWTYIHAVHTEGMYGENGMEEFKAMLSKTGACIAVDKKLKSNVPTGDIQYMELLNEIRSKGKDKAKVIVCFCDGGAVRGIFNATATYRRMHPDYDGKFMVIGSDGWNVREDVVKGLESTANGGVSIKLHSPKIEDFEYYLSNINPMRNERNPWYQEFWEWRFNCTFDQTLHGWRKACDPSRPEQRIDPETVEQDAKLGFVVNAVYALAHAFHSMLTALCPRRTDFSGCPFINQTINGSMVFSFLRNVTFISYSNDSIKFDEFMDGVGRYEIMNYRLNESLIGPHGRQGVYEYQKVGWWDSGNLWLKDLIEWPNVTDDQERNIESVCSKPCEKGKVKKIQEGGVPCCWSCQQCLDHEYIISDSRCMPCQPGWWPDENLTCNTCICSLTMILTLFVNLACLPLEIRYKSPMDKDSVVCILFSLFGVLSCAFVFIIFVRHNSTPVIKASTRELTYIILAGIFLSYLTTIPLLLKPTLVSCYFTRILPGFSFSLIYGALATKTNRIARILSGSKKKIITRKPRFLSASAQVVITCLIVGTECVIITLMLILEPADSVLDYPTKKEVRLKCNTTDYGLMVPFGFDMFLIMMCTLYAVRTRNMPENFNEAKFIGFCMYATCSIWASFVPIYYNSESRMTTMSFCISASATAALLFLFYPKIYIMVYQPEKNTKSAFNQAAEGSSGRSRRESNAPAQPRRAEQAPMPVQQVRRSPARTVDELKERLVAAEQLGSVMRSNAEMEFMKDKLVEAIIPPMAPPKMPKPKTISELMHQRRISVASAGSAERLIVAALRHSRASMVPGLMGPGGLTDSRSDSFTTSQEVLTRVEPVNEQVFEDEEQHSNASSRSHEHITKKGSRSRTHSDSSEKSNDSMSSKIVKGGDEPQTPKIELENSQETPGDNAPPIETPSSISSELTTINSIPNIQVDSQITSPAIDQRLLAPTGQTALLLPRPSPIPEEDEENDNTSSHRGSISPQLHPRQSSLHRSGSKQSGSLHKQHSNASSGTVSSVATNKAAQKATSSDGGKKSLENDNLSQIYVNLDAIQHQKQAVAEAAMRPVAAAPPLPPKPVKLSTPSALAGRLIDHIYHSTRLAERKEKERSQTSSPSKQQRPYVIPEGPPRPTSPTEFEERRLHKKIKYQSGRSTQQGALSRLVLPFAMDIPKVLRRQRHEEERLLVSTPMPPPVNSPDTTNESSMESSTNAEAADRSRLLPVYSRTGKSPVDVRSILVSPMSSTSFDIGRQKPARYSSSSDEPPSRSNIVPQQVPSAATGSQFLESNNSCNDSTPYDDADSDTASTPSTTVAARIAHAERHAQQMANARQIYQPRPAPWVTDPGGPAHHPQQRSRSSPPGHTVKKRFVDNSVVGKPPVTPSASSVSEDTLADLPSIEELSVTGMRLLDDEETSAVRFRDYMNDMGVDIDITVFQSTEV